MGEDAVLAGGEGFGESGPGAVEGEDVGKACGEVGGGAGEFHGFLFVAEVYGHADAVVAVRSKTYRSGDLV